MIDQTLSSESVPLPAPHFITIAHVVYGLHALSVIMGVSTAAFIVTAFLSGWPSILAVVISYFKCGEVKGTFLESHFRWQIGTFWWSLLWMLIWAIFAIPLYLSMVGIPLIWAMGMVLGVWVIYRIARGWLALFSHESLPA
jgi:uncharacterized membrane protein